MPGSRTFSGRKNIKSKKPNAATLTPMPSASISTAAAMKPGDFRNILTQCAC